MFVTDDTPPTPHALAEIKAGLFVAQDVRFTKEKMGSFISLSKDEARIHRDLDFANEQGYDDCIVHGLMLGMSFSRLLGMYLPGEISVIRNLKLEFRKPVLVGDKVTYRVEASKVVAAVGAVILKLSIERDGEVLVSGTSECVFPGVAPRA